MPESIVDGKINVLAVMIDYYNRYSMFGGIIILVIASIFGQGKIVRAISHLEEVDDCLEQNFRVVIDSSQCGRFVILLRLQS